MRNGFEVGPEYLLPGAPVAEHWIDYNDPRVTSEEVDLSQWWHVFEDPILDGLIEDAGRQNLTLRVAGARIMEARAELGFTEGNLFPQSQGIGGSDTRIKTPDPANQFFDQWSTDASFAWELDFWGRFGRAIEAAEAELDASVDEYDDVLVLLYSDVAANYVNYRTFEERLAFSRKNVEMQEASFQLAQTKFNEGATSQADVQQARQVLEQTRTLIPTLETGLRHSSNALCTLLGMRWTPLVGQPTGLIKIVGLAARGTLPRSRAAAEAG
jgi:outer membrane protein TolC